MRLRRHPPGTIAIGSLARAHISPWLLVPALALSLPPGIPSADHVASEVVELADVHLDEALSTGEFELNVEITQTENDCGAPLNGQLCLRYSITQDDHPVEDGVGLIPLSDVSRSGSTLTLSTSTNAYPHFHRFAGGGGSLLISWTPAASGTAVTAGNQTTLLHPCTVRGTVLGHALSGTELHSGLLTALTSS